MNKKRLHMLNNELGLDELTSAPDTKNIINKVYKTLNNNCSDTYSNCSIFIKRTKYAAVIAILILSVASLAIISAKTGWHHKLIKYFNNPTTEQTEQISLNTDYPMISETNGNITVSILQTIADNHGIYVLYEIDGIGSIQKNDVISWDKQRLKVKYDDTDKKPGMGGYSYSKVISIQNNKCTMLYIRTGSANIKSQNLVFELDTLKKSVLSSENTVTDTKIILNGKFKLKWNFKKVNYGKVLTVNQKINNGANEIKTVDISPISMWITVAGKELNNINGIKINLKNGKVVNINNTDLNIQYSPKEKENIISLEFNEIIMTDEIESITVENNTVFVKF